MGRDSNPRYLAVHTLSRRAQSTALAPIRNEPTSLVSIGSGCNPFVTPGRFDPRSRRWVDRTIRGAALEMCGRYIWKRSIARLTQRPICRGSRWCGTSTILSTQRVKTCCIPGRRVSPNARSATIFSADMRASYNTECNAPPVFPEELPLIPTEFFATVKLG